MSLKEKSKTLDVTVFCLHYNWVASPHDSLKSRRSDRMFTQKKMKAKSWLDIAHHATSETHERGLDRHFRSSEAFGVKKV